MNVSIKPVIARVDGSFVPKTVPGPTFTSNQQRSATKRSTTRTLRRCLRPSQLTTQSNSLTENRNPAHGRPEVRDGTWRHRVTPRACTADANFMFVELTFEANHRGTCKYLIGRTTRRTPNQRRRQRRRETRRDPRRNRPVTPHRRSRSRPRNLGQKRPGSRRQRRRKSEGQTPD